VADPQTVRVETGDAGDTDDLLEALSVRGLEARRTGADEIEIAAPAAPELWNLEIVSALEAWLEQTDHEAVVARLGSRRFTVRAPDRRVPVDAEPAADRATRIGVVAVGVAALVVLAVAIWLILGAVSGIW
jgi:hypothetical protein